LSFDRFERERQRQVKPIFAVHMNVEQLDRRCDLVPALRLHAVVALGAVPFVSKHIVLCGHHDVGVPLVSVKHPSFVNEESDVLGKVAGACFASRLRLIRTPFEPVERRRVRTAVNRDVPLFDTLKSRYWCVTKSQSNVVETPRTALVRPVNFYFVYVSHCPSDRNSAYRP